MSRLTVDLSGLKGALVHMYLTPGDQRRTDIEWLGVIRRSSHDAGALGRLRASGKLVQVNASATRTLDQCAAEAALVTAQRGRD